MLRGLCFGGVSAKESSDNSRSPIGGPSDEVCEAGRLAPSAIAGAREKLAVGSLGSATMTFAKFPDDAIRMNLPGNLFVVLRQNFERESIENLGNLSQKVT
jgi:hypothetical protein